MGISSINKRHKNSKSFTQLDPQLKKRLAKRNTLNYRIILTKSRIHQLAWIIHESRPTHPTPMAWMIHLLYLKCFILSTTHDIRKIYASVPKISSSAIVMMSLEKTVWSVFAINAKNGENRHGYTQKCRNIRQNIKLPESVFLVLSEGCFQFSLSSVFF